MSIHLILLTLLVVVFCAPAGGEQVTLSTGETLVGKVIERTTGGLILEHPVLGRLAIPAAHVSAVHTGSEAADGEQPEGGEPRTVAVAPSPQAAQQPALTPAEPGKPAPLFSDWDLRFEVGLSGSDGNSETSSVRLGFNGNKKDEQERWLLEGTYNSATSAGETTRNEFHTEVTRDWLMPGSAWFTFVQGRYDFDEFEAWDHRVSGFAGVGYELIKTERFEMVVRTAAGATKEFGGANDLRPEGLVSAAVLKWKPTDRQTVAASATFFPHLDDFGEFRLVNKLEWEIRIDQADGLSLKFGIDNEYESRTENDSLHNDLKYYSSLVIDF